MANDDLNGNVVINAGQFKKAMELSNISFDEVFKELPANTREEYVNAFENGGDFRVPLGDWVNATINHADLDGLVREDGSSMNAVDAFGVVDTLEKGIDLFDSSEVEAIPAIEDDGALESKAPELDSEPVRKLADLKRDHDDAINKLAQKLSENKGTFTEEEIALARTIPAMQYSFIEMSEDVRLQEMDSRQESGQEFATREDYDRERDSIILPEINSSSETIIQIIESINKLSNQKKDITKDPEAYKALRENVRAIIKNLEDGDIVPIGKEKERLAKAKEFIDSWPEGPADAVERVDQVLD